MTIRNVASIFAIIALCAILPQNRAWAGSRDGAFAAGMIGAAIGTAILMQGSRGGPAYYNQRGHRKPARSSRSRSVAPKEAKASKDPFAGAAAPADYAKPVKASGQ